MRNFWPVFLRGLDPKFDGVLPRRAVRHVAGQFRHVHDIGVIFRYFKITSNFFGFYAKDYRAGPCKNGGGHFEIGGTTFGIGGAAFKTGGGAFKTGGPSFKSGGNGG